MVAKFFLDFAVTGGGRGYCTAELPAGQGP